ncbi:MAG: nuclear transport factor 2 family protein [Deltaproteobacteria bacterium]|nr:nuclear transport factor 2 family protein [Deltaproteobacteria bacterium]
MDKAIQELIDLRAIEQLMVRYAERIDANDPEGAAACFAEDGIGKYWGTFQGRQAIAGILTIILDLFSTTSHHLTNVSIKLDGDKATGMSYVYAFHRMAENNEPLHYWGRWVDRYIRTDEGWLFAEREVAGIGDIETEKTLSEDKSLAFVHPGHPGRLQR